MEIPTLSVSEAISVCNSLLGELTFSIEGEVAGYSMNRGKFVFFELKDETQDARISCFMMAYQLSSPIEDGMRVVIEGRPSLYVKSGQFKITVGKITPKGEGSVKRAYELLLKKLQAEGLFAVERKRRLSRYPERVGIISSADAAGYGDFKKIVMQRLPGVTFTMLNVAVQGKDSEREICAAFDYLNGHFDLEAIVLIRGGGSMEDLQSFNSELVARAIVRSKAPVVVGVGHEKDITIADYCADVRASTPSNAAQLLLPTAEEAREYVIRLTQDGRRRVERTIELQRERTKNACERTNRALLYSIQHAKDRVGALVKTIVAISPHETLKRGYSITQDEQGKLVTSVQEVKVGTILVTTLSDGSLQSVTL